MSQGVLEVFQVEAAPATRVTVAGAGNVAIPTLINGDKPRYIWFQTAIGSASVVGDAVTVSPEITAVNGNAATGVPIVIGAPGLVLNVHGSAFIGYDFVSGGTNIELYIVPLLNQ